VVLHVTGTLVPTAVGAGAGAAAAAAAAGACGSLAFSECFILARTPSGEYYCANQVSRLVQ
jgi:hypothetical protein